MLAILQLDLSMSIVRIYKLCSQSLQNMSRICQIIYHFKMVILKLYIHQFIFDLSRLFKLNTLPPKKPPFDLQVVPLGEILPKAAKTLRK